MRCFSTSLLAQHGFAVLHADNRGMSGRGREFAQAAYHNFGPVQLRGSVDGSGCSSAKISAARCEAAGLVGVELGRYLHAVRDDAF